MMPWNPDVAWFIMMIFGATVFILIMFLPAFLELKKPKDAGPRRITGEDAISDVATDKIQLCAMEEEVMPDQALVKKIAEVISVLPNLEA